MVVFFLHIASKSTMLVGSVFALVLCHSNLSTSHESFPFSTTSWVDVARPIKDHMNLCISVVALN